MATKLQKQISMLASQINVDPQIATQYRLRVQKGRLTRDENPSSHFCVYFAAIDPKRKEAFIGHHKKANIWLFTGGHVDQREVLEEAVQREIWEEWGQRMSLAKIPKPSLLTVTKVITPTIACNTHFDIWHFFPTDKGHFKIDQSKIAKEFHEIGWFSVADVMHRVTDPATLIALRRVVTET